MKDIRIHNDIHIGWGILHKGVPYSLEGTNISVYLRTPFGKREVKDFKIEGNKVKWTFFGKNQEMTGKYSLELVINEGAEGMVTTDYCNFVNLVACSCKVGGADEGNVETETIELTSTLEYVAGGGSYDDTEVKNELARLEKEKQDTITDLATIREGAFKGATALQSVPDEYATKTYVDEKVAQSGVGGASNEWKCIYDRIPEVGVDAINIETCSDGTPLKAQEAIVQILIDTQADANRNGYVYIKSTTNNKIWNAFGVIDFQNNSASADNMFLQQIHFKASPIMYMVAEIYNKMQSAVNNNVEIKAGIGSKGPQVYEDISLIKLVVNGALTTPPHIKVFVR